MALHLASYFNIKASERQGKANILSAYTKIYLFFLQYYFSLLIILLSLFFDIFLLKRVADPIQNQPIVRLQFSSLGLFPKMDGDLRLIHHISYPEGHSISILLIQGPVLFITQTLMRQQA